MTALKKKIKKVRQIKRKNMFQKFRGVAGDGILWGIILIGMVIMGFFLTGNALPKSTGTVTGAPVTIIPHKDQGSKSNIQMEYFGGVTGKPEPTKEPKAMPTEDPKAPTPTFILPASN